MKVSYLMVEGKSSALKPLSLISREFSSLSFTANDDAKLCNVFHQIIHSSLLSPYKRL
jgi:hypothetical protein